MVTVLIQKKDKKKTKSNDWLIANLASPRAPIVKMFFPGREGSFPIDSDFLFGRDFLIYFSQ